MPAIPVDSWYIGAGDIYLDAVKIGATRENNVFRIARELEGCRRLAGDDGEVGCRTAGGTTATAAAAHGA